MKVYTSYYGASSSKPIGFQAQSKEIEGAIINSALKELSSLRPLSAMDKDDEMLMYMVKSQDAIILGLSYTEAASSSGYNRSAPCGLQYVFEEKDFDAASISRTLNFAIFKKPDSSNPPALNAIPESENGYYYKNPVAATAAVVDALVKTLLSGESEPVLVALPQTKSSRYAMARYTVSEIVSCLPADIRGKVSFFTDLPIVGDTGDALAAFDKAVSFGANLIFCQSDVLNRLNGRRTFVSVDMNRPEKAAAYADYVASSDSRGEAISTIAANVQGSVSYDALNRAAQQVASGNVATIKELKERITKGEKEIDSLRTRYDKDIGELKARYSKDVGKLGNDYDKLSDKYDELEEKYYRLKNSSSSSRKKRYIDKKLIIIAAVCAVVLMAATAMVTYLISRPASSVNNADVSSASEKQAETSVVSADNDEALGNAITDSEEVPAKNTQTDDDDPVQSGELNDKENNEAESNDANGNEPAPEAANESEQSDIADDNKIDDTETRTAENGNASDEQEAQTGKEDIDDNDVETNEPEVIEAAPVATASEQPRMVVLSDIESSVFEAEIYEFQNVKTEDIDLSGYDGDCVIILLYNTEEDLSSFDSMANVHIVKYMAYDEDTKSFEYNGEKYDSLEKILEIIAESAKEDSTPDADNE